MAINPVVAKHLQDARLELVKQRDTLDADIAHLDSMLQGYAAAPSVTATGAGEPRPVPRGPAPPMRDAIIDHLYSEDREFSTNEVAVALRERYGWELSSTRSLISKMGKDGAIVAVRRGVYRAVTPNVPDALLDEMRVRNAGSPADTGLPGGVTATGDGGDVHAQTDRDHGDHLADGDRDDRRGASIGAS